jgi:hypothetical protein
MTASARWARSSLADGLRPPAALSWQHTTMLIDERRGNCDEDIREISRSDAKQIAAGLSALLAAGRGPAALGHLGLSGMTSLPILLALPLGRRAAHAAPELPRYADA